MFCFILISISTQIVSAQEQSQDDINLLDVYALDSSCLTEESCDAWRPDSLIEYFGADWCDPCREVESEIGQVNRSRSVIVHHHPSPLDYTFLDHSKIKFDYEYRLLFIPSIVINGNGLLTGSSQALEINQVIDDSNSSFSGIDEITYQNGTLYWNASDGYKLNIWKLEDTQHEFENYSHPHLATSFLSFDSANKSANISSWMSNWDGRLVFLLEDTGPMKLKPASNQPTGEIEFNQGDKQNGGISVIKEIKPSTLAIITGLVLFAALLPALIMFQGLRNLDPEDSSSEE